MAPGRSLTFDLTGSSPTATISSLTLPGTTAHQLVLDWFCCIICH